MKKLLTSVAVLFALAATSANAASTQDDIASCRTAFEAKGFLSEGETLRFKKKRGASTRTLTLQVLGGEERRTLTCKVNKHGVQEIAVKGQEAIKVASN